MDGLNLIDELEALYMKRKPRRPRHYHDDLNGQLLAAVADAHNSARKSRSPSFG